MGSDGEFPPIKRRGSAACCVTFKAARGFGKSRVRFVPSAFLSCLERRSLAPTSHLSDSPLNVLVPLNIKRDTALSDNGADRKISQTKCDSQPQCVPRRRHPFCIILFYFSAPSLLNFKTPSDAFPLCSGRRLLSSSETQAQAAVSTCTCQAVHLSK